MYCNVTPQFVSLLDSLARLIVCWVYGGYICSNWALSTEVSSGFLATHGSGEAAHAFLGGAKYWVHWISLVWPRPSVATRMTFGHAVSTFPIGFQPAQPKRGALL